MSVPIPTSTTSISTNHRDCMNGLWQRFLPSSAITSPPLPKIGMALMLVPRDLRLFRSKAAYNKTPTIPRHLRTSRRPIHNHFTLKKYKIDRRWIDRWKIVASNCAMSCAVAAQFVLQDPPNHRHNPGHGFPWNHRAGQRRPDPHLLNFTSLMARFRLREKRLVR
jgi:hypothetical protein